ncbi:MAG: T9SS type A sorting domain-containing protein [Ignavibacteriae bacterium]|nr:T9SS type A sorting domain-containing protein [Ignavibacteriota bacterium]MCB9217238.1 T9SS type A sorting domain-containing protein [Ignavibacteria bacterium]
MPTSSVNQGYSTTIVVLSHAVPNPFSTETTIHFALEKPSELQPEIINPLGRMVLSESLGGVASGTQSVRVTGDSFIAGIYHYRIIVNDGEDH